MSIAPQGSMRVGLARIAVTISAARNCLAVLQVAESIAVRSLVMSFVGGKLKKQEVKSFGMVVAAIASALLRVEVGSLVARFAVSMALNVLMC